MLAPQFTGLVYSYSESENNAISAWIECAIYRTDRDGAIVMPGKKSQGRMLRNRAF